MMRYFILFCLLSFVFISDTYAERIGVLATVNGYPVTLADVLEISSPSEEELSKLYKGDELNKEILKLRKQVLETVIERKLIYQDFVSNEFKLPREFVESNIESIIKSFNVSTRQELEAILRQEGKTFDEFKDKVYESIAVEALIFGRANKDVFVTPAEIYNYYNVNIAEFTTEPSIKLRIISIMKKGVNNQDSLPMVRHLQKSLADKGESEFVDAVSLYSAGPNIDNGGEIPWMKVGDLREEFAKVLTIHEPGTICGPAETDNAFFFFYVSAYREAKIKSFEDARKEIRDKLLAEAKKKAYRNYVDSLRRKAFVQYFI